MGPGAGIRERVGAGAKRATPAKALVASLAEKNPRVTLWGCLAGEHAKEVTSTCFTPDGTQLVTGSVD